MHSENLLSYNRVFLSGCGTRIRAQTQQQSWRRPAHHSPSLQPVAAALTLHCTVDSGPGVKDPFCSLLYKASDVLAASGPKGFLIIEFPVAVPLYCNWMAVFGGSVQGTQCHKTRSILEKGRGVVH